MLSQRPLFFSINYVKMTSLELPDSEENTMDMECSRKIKELRESTGMNRTEFCEYFGIPYRTVTEWERDNRHAPEYLIRLLEYYIRSEKLTKKDK